jgi:hypothetical protein
VAEERGWRLVQGTEVGADGAVVFTGQYADANPAVGETDDRRIALLRARIKAHRSEATRLEVELDVVLAARAAGVSLWGSELAPPVLQQVLQHLQWEPAVCGVMRAVCSTWGGVIDALLPRLRPRRSAAVMQGKLGWYQSVTEVDLKGCEEAEDVSSVLAELESMPSLRSLSLPSSCAERAVDAEAMYGLTTLTTLRIRIEIDEYGDPAELAEVEEWVLDLSRLPSLTNSTSTDVSPSKTSKCSAASPHSPRSTSPSATR